MRRLLSIAVIRDPYSAFNLSIFATNPPLSITKRTIADVKGFSPPPLSSNPDVTKRLIVSEFDWSHPNRKPGARIFENELIEMICPSLIYADNGSGDLQR